jgi:hypothetical protein
MLKSNKKTPLDNFTSSLCDVSILYKMPFSELYPWHFNDITDALKKEIVDNLTSLSDTKFDAYLKYVKDEIEKVYYYDPNNCIIEEWIKKYDLKENDFPFYEDDNVSFLIRTVCDDPNLGIEKKKLVKLIQLGFFWYAVFLESKTIIAFIDELFLEKSSQKSNKVSNPPVNPYPKIFKDYKSYTIFKNLLDEFGNTKENLSNYSFVFHKMTHEDLIHCDLKQQAYFSFLDGFDISISRIKPSGDIGKILFRESIYAKAK